MKCAVGVFGLVGVVGVFSIVGQVFQTRYMVWGCLDVVGVLLWWVCLVLFVWWRR